VRLENVVKSYGRGETAVRAVAGVSLAIAPREFVAIVGPSGSGKSTLLHLMAGLDLPDAGQVFVGGKSLQALSDDAVTVLRRRQIGVVFQFFNLLPMLTAEENVALPLVLDGVRLRAARPRARAMLERVGLGHRARHRPDQLSGGEMQRVAIARALVTGPLVLLADEPTGNLDSHTGEEILALVREMAERHGQAVVMVTHDARAAAHAQRVLAMRDGQVERADAR